MRGQSAIASIGCAVPAHALAQEEAVGFMVAAHGFEGREARRLRELYRLTRIERRHSVIPDYGLDPDAFTFFPRNARLVPPPGTARRMEVFEREALPLAMAAARECLDDAGAIAPDRIFHLIVVSCTGAAAPGLDGKLAVALGLRDDVGRTLIGFQGCHAGLSALRVADGLARSRPDGAVLVVCVELSTLHFQLDTSDENLVANAIFADGAAAVLVTGPALAGRAGPRWEIDATRTLLRAAASDAMSWKIGDTGFALHLSTLLPRIVASEVRAAIAPLRDDAPESFWAVHPGGIAILQAVERALELPGDALAASRAVLRGYGNMSSPTIFFVLRELAAAGAGGHGMALAFGPGLTIEAVRLTRC